VSAVSESSDRHGVLAIVGTDHHPFDRLVSWLDEWAQRHPEHRCFVQFGTSRPPQICSGTAYLGHSELQSRIQQAAAVVTHGGPGTIMEVRAAGLLPLVIPRNPSLGEHVDAHQQRFTKIIAGHGLVRAAASATELKSELEQMLSHPQVALTGTSRSATEEAALNFGSLVERLIRAS